MLRGPRGLIATLLVAALLIAGAIVFGFRGQKDDVATARAFLNHLSAAEISQAHGLLHASITGNLSESDLRTSVQGMQAYADISFPSFGFSTVNGRRTTELSGTGTTADGCESALEFELLNGVITYFNIEPLCFGAPGTDA